MTIPRGMAAATQKVSEFVREMFPRLRVQLTPEEADLGTHLRGNERLMMCLRKVIEARIAGRAKVPEPSDPVACKSILARDRELQWLLGRLEFVYHSPVNPAQADAEQPE